MSRKECQSPARLPRSIVIAGRTFNSASTSRSIATGSRNYDADRSQSADVYIYDIPLSRLLHPYSLALYHL